MLKIASLFKFYSDGLAFLRQLIQYYLKATIMFISSILHGWDGNRDLQACVYACYSLVVDYWTPALMHS